MIGARLLSAFLLCATLIPAHAADNPIPVRETPRPVTTKGVPHVQLGVEVVPALYDALLSRVAELPGVRIRNTIVSLPGAKGFWLSEDLELARPDVIVGGREFAHVHPDGSLHASLDPKIAQVAVERGWATPHPWSGQRPGWEGFVMIYTPVSEDEVDVVFELIKGGYVFVTGRSL